MGKKKKVKISQVFDPNLIPDSYVRNNKNQDRGHLFANYVGKEIHAGRALAILLGGNAETGSGHGGAFYVHPEHMLRMQQEFDAKQLAVGALGGLELAQQGLHSLGPALGTRLDSCDRIPRGILATQLVHLAIETARQTVDLGQSARLSASCQRRP